ncbi:MAG: molybdenum-dependent transcriptional regulator [Phenylobacterium zucineum]|nr:MAG: molybdenum-dependent transcriptional regulator [Phenylobacterium zucineum]
MPQSSPLSAGLVLRRVGQSAVGADRIALLEAVGTHGSITGAASAVGLSYKGAWDAIQTLNNLFDRPLVASQAGGSRGGSAVLTPDGRAVISAFRAIEGELAQALVKVETHLASAAEGPTHDWLWSLAMKSSARNVLRGVVAGIAEGAVNAEVTLAIGGEAHIVAVVTRRSVADLGLVPGVPALALINAGFIVLAAAEGKIRTSARNSLLGVITDITRGAVNDEVTLEIAEGKSLTATVTHESVEAMALAVGLNVLALVKASHVILATA